MLRPTRKLVLGTLFVAAIAAALYVVLRPKSVPVDLASVARGPMRVAVEEEGKTRVRNAYTISSPVAGRLMRIALDAGDPVEKLKTVVAIIQPAAPPFLDERSRHEAGAQIAAARAAVQLAEAELRQSRSELDFAVSELSRAETLVRTQAASERAREKAGIDVEVRRSALARAEANVEVRKRELETAQYRLIGPDDLPGHSDLGENCCVNVKSPVSGHLLKRLMVSETIVAAGTPLVEVGDISDTEIVVELLSTDAVKITEGAAASIDGWGGQRALEARVRRIEPAGFTKVSALGIEEQRVRVILDFTAEPQVRRRLGHDYRVFVSITTWASPDVLRVPLSALVRSADRWAVFRSENERARLVPIDVGHRNSEHAEVTGGLAPGDLIVLHPSDRVADGARIFPREVR